ncbi:TfoX/Sxy family protein [Niveibacterium umoris]
MVARRNEYVDWLCERLAPLGSIRARRMFGAWGLYSGEFFFAIVSDDVFYVKADAVSEADFLREGLTPFTYAMKDGTPQSLRYYPLPESAIDDDGEFLRWARKGVEAALRAPRKLRRPEA